MGGRREVVGLMMEMEDQRCLKDGLDLRLPLVVVDPPS